MSKPYGVQDYLESTDPLSDQACMFLLDYREEDSRVDFKKEFDPSSDECWINLAIDVVAFANTYVGYVIFGVEDKTYQRVGIPENAQSALANTKVMLEKVNRGVNPKLLEIRTKAKEVDGLKYVFVAIPQTKDRTHIFENNLDATFPSGKKPIIRKGSIYIRSSASNQIISSDAFEDLLSRRFKRIREKILEGMSRVVHAEPTQEIVVVSPQLSEDGTKLFRITDAPDAISIRGASLTAVPKTFEEKISAWISIQQVDPNNLPPPKSLMEVYSQRHDLTLLGAQKQQLALFSLIQGLPAFYWLKDLSKEQAQKVVEKSFDGAKNIERFYILNVSGFYGKETYRSYESKLSRNTEAIVRPFTDLQSLFRINRTTSSMVDQEATELAKGLAVKESASDLSALQKLDCALYAPFT